MMNYEIKISESGKYIIVKYFSDMTVGLAEKSNKEAEQLAKENNIKQMLIDVRNSVNRESIDKNIFFSQKQLPDVSKSAFEKIAFLTSQGDNSHNIVYIASTNAGYNVGMYTDEEEAIEWLEE